MSHRTEYSMSEIPPKRLKSDNSPQVSNTGARDCKTDRSCVAGHVDGNVSFNTNNFHIHIDTVIFRGRAAAISKLIDRGKSFSDDQGGTNLGSRKKNRFTQSVETSSKNTFPCENQQPERSSRYSILEYELDNNLNNIPTSFTNLEEIGVKQHGTHESSDDSDSSSGDNNETDISDNQLCEEIFSSVSEEDSDIKEITDDYIHAMIIRDKEKKTGRAAELKIRLEEVTDPSDADIPIQGQGETEAGDLKLSSRHKLEEPVTQRFEIDLSEIADPRFRIVTKENVNKTVQIARYKPGDTGKVTSFLETMFQRSHVYSDGQDSLSAHHTENQLNSGNMKRIRHLRRVFVIDMNKLDDTSTVTIDLSDITHNNGYVLLKTKHNVEIIVNIAEKDPQTFPSS